jgi:hypothetical protein
MAKQYSEDIKYVMSVVRQCERVDDGVVVDSTCSKNNKCGNRKEAWRIPGGVS